jgi:hypothetical protein
MSLSGIGLNKLNENVDFEAIENRYTHKLLKGNFAILPTRKGTHIFALLGKANGIKKIMTTNPLFGLHYIDLRIWPWLLILCFMRKILKTGLRTSVRLTASGK